MQIPVKAAPGALVRDPFTKQPLPQLGGDEDPVLVDGCDLHWARTFSDGDIVRCDRKTAPSKKDDKA